MLLSFAAYITIWNGEGIEVHLRLDYSLIYLESLNYRCFGLDLATGP